MKEFPLFKYYLRMIQQFAVFTGRADRTEYWWAVGMHCLVTVVLRYIISLLSVFQTLLDGSGIGIRLFSMLLSTLLTLYSLAVIIPFSALTARRLHDTNRSGWWSLISGTGVGTIVLLIWLCQKGTDDTNLFGSDPHPIRQY